jgi:hypothetical protein
LGGAPNAVADAENAFDAVVSWTWTSSPTTTSQSVTIDLAGSVDRL